MLTGARTDSRRGRVIGAGASESREGGHVREGRQIAGDRPSAVVSAMSWLRRRRTLCLALALLGLVVILFVDLLIPGYAVAAAYLVLVVFAAIALTQVTAIVIGSAGLALTLTVMATQGRMNGENLLLVWFGVLAGAGMFALVSLYNSVETLYMDQRASLERGSFLVRLVDALLPLDDPLDVEADHRPARGRTARRPPDGLLRSRRDRPAGRPQHLRAGGLVRAPGPRCVRRRPGRRGRLPGARAAGPGLRGRARRAATGDA